MKINRKHSKIITLSVLLAMIVASCSDSSPEVVAPITPPPVVTTTDFTYEVTVTNLTHAQPLSPVAVVSHGDMSLWTIGESADLPLEMLAESGDNTMLLANSALFTAESGAGVLLPGVSETITIVTTMDDAPMLSIVTMLVNTNDAFTGKTAIDVSALDVDGSISMMTVSYDAGTEANSEAMGSIPGPADGGEGFNEMRNDVDFVSQHPGLVTMDDGLTTSVLTEAHKFDNPVMKIVITRTQ